MKLIWQKFYTGRCMGCTVVWEVPASRLSFNEARDVLEAEIATLGCGHHANDRMFGERYVACGAE